MTDVERCQNLLLKNLDTADENEQEHKPFFRPLLKTIIITSLMLLTIDGGVTIKNIIQNNMLDKLIRNLNEPNSTFN